MPNIIEHTIRTTQIKESELDESERLLLQSAKEATDRSYAPYSNFRVGVALLMSNDEIITGNNQENCAYPSGLCAERTALFYAKSKYLDCAIDTIIITARDTNGEFTPTPISPCGGCRQVMLETEMRQSKNIKIILYGTEYITVIHSAKDLLPLSFDNLFHKK